jgi:hypothetical protein
MADFPTALDTALGAFYSVRDDYKSPVESTRGFKARVGALEKAYGSKAAAARAAGISPDTWSRWTTKGRAPGRDSLRKIAAAHIALLRAAKVARKGYPSLISIQATVAASPSASFGRDPKKKKYYNGGSSSAEGAYRWFNADQLTAQQLRDVVNAWAAGGSPRDVADALQREIERAYPGRFEFEGNNVNVDIRK